jgi:valyl-tRNA synthetase
LTKPPSPNENIKWEELEKVEIMTTRPELLPACVALVCHPDDAAKYHGKKAVTPLFNVAVPIIADDKVAKDKGTGLVMCCTFGDETDIHWWQKHKLQTRIVLNKFGKLDFSDAALFEGQPQVNRTHLEALEGKKTDHQEAKLSARKTAIALLEENGLTSQSKIAIKHSVKCAERSGSALEIIPTNQWFVKVVDKKEALKEKAQACEWHPAYMYKRVEQWIDSLSWDWCISRQRYFGVPFPVWFIKEESGDKEKFVGVEYASSEELPVNPLVSLPRKYSTSEYKVEEGQNSYEKEKPTKYWKVTNLKTGKIFNIFPEADVMDTWATSSISPQISSKSINKEFALDYARHEKLFPADIRPQAHEIIRTWAFYTIAKGLLHENTIPWKNLMISGWCLASDKTKMSKSKGNVITPTTLIQEKGADSVRYWSSTSRLGADTAFSEDVLKIGNKLVNKLWNATKFASIQLNKLTETPTTAADDVKKGNITETLDKWIISRLHKAIAKATKEFEVFEYADARSAIEDFFWNDFCDNYLEIVKVRAYDEKGENPQGQKSAVHTIYHCLNAILKLFAPFTPHITEELYAHIFDAEYAKTGSIHARGQWPKAENFAYDETSETAGIITREILDVIRKVKAEANVSVKFPLELIEIEQKDSKIDLNSIIEDLKCVTSAEKVAFSSNNGEKLPSFDIKIAAKLGEKKEEAA